MEREMAVAVQVQALQAGCGDRKQKWEHGLPVGLRRQKTEMAVLSQEKAWHVGLQRQKLERGCLCGTASRCAETVNRTGVPLQEQVLKVGSGTENRNDGGFCKSRHCQLEDGDRKHKRWCLCRSRH